MKEVQLKKYLQKNIIDKYFNNSILDIHT